MRAQNAALKTKTEQQEPHEKIIVISLNDLRQLIY